MVNQKSLRRDSSSSTILPPHDGGGAVPSSAKTIRQPNGVDKGTADWMTP